MTKCPKFTIFTILPPPQFFPIFWLGGGKYPLPPFPAPMRLLDPALKCSFQYTLLYVTLNSDLLTPNCEAFISAHNAPVTYVWCTSAAVLFKISCYRCFRTHARTDEPTGQKKHHAFGHTKLREASSTTSVIPFWRLP